MFAKIADLPPREEGAPLRLSGRQMLRVLASKGLLRDDPRLTDVAAALDELGGRGAALTFQDFREATAPSQVRRFPPTLAARHPPRPLAAAALSPHQKLIKRALGGDLVVADFESFSATVEELFRFVRVRPRPCGLGAAGTRARLRPGAAGGTGVAL